MLFLLHVVVGTQLWYKPAASALVEIMTCTTSLVHQPSAEDLGCGLLFAPTAVLRIPGYGESCNFIEVL